MRRSAFTTVHTRGPALPWVALSVGLAALAGCYSGVEGAAGDADTDGGTDSADAGDSANDGGDPLGCGEDASLSPLRRLSEAQYRNTLRDLFAPADIDVADVATTELARIPTDEAGPTFKILDARVSEQHARAYYLLADRLADATAYDDANLTNLAGDCAVAPEVSDACIDAFLDDFGTRVYRRPLSETERARYRAVKATAADGTELFRELVFSMLMAPAFLYHLELDGEGDDDRFELGSYGLASRLSFHFWQSMPDAELFAAAADGSLLTADGYQAQLDRVFEDPRTQETIDRFYDDWLQLGWLQQWPTTPAFATLAEGTSIGEPDADHLQAAQAEIHALTRYYTWTQPGSLADLYLTDRSFTQSSHLAALYGVQAWDGQADPPAMPSGERAGLLTRAAFVLTGTHETHPVHRGAALHRRLLCTQLQPPDPASLPPGALDPPPVTEDQTTRERYEDKTSDGACAGCHQLINPVGFVLESYDALGRYRTEERVIDEATGEVVATLPLDLSVTSTLTGEETVISSAFELSQQVVDSGQAEACFARQYFRATFGREEAEADACAVDAIEAALVDGGSLRDALRTIALAPVFRARRVR